MKVKLSHIPYLGREVAVMVRIRVKLFAVFADAVGAKELVISLSKEKVKAKDILEYIRSKYPKFRESEKVVPVLMLVNGVNVLPDNEVKEGDEVSLLPPASGG